MGEGGQPERQGVSEDDPGVRRHEAVVGPGGSLQTPEARRTQQGAAETAAGARRRQDQVKQRRHRSMVVATPYRLVTTGLPARRVLA